MINAAAMMGLANDPAMQAIRGMQQSLANLTTLKTTDTKDEVRYQKRQAELDKRERQDVNRLQQAEAREVEKAKRLMKTTEGGKMAALLGGVALMGALAVIAGLDPTKLANQVVDGTKNLLGRDADNMDEYVDSMTPPGGDITDTTSDGETPAASRDLDPASGGVENLEGTEDDANFKPLPRPAYLEVTSRVGPRWGKIHAGVDIAAPEGTPMTVWTGAKITDKGYEAAGYGHWVTFKTKKGEHMYAHMKAPAKGGKGATVRRGEIIGLCGNSGGSKGAHLHWEYDPQMGKVGYVRKNPIDVLNAGYKATQPFLGKQEGGMVGQILPIVQKQTPLGSLTYGQNDTVSPGGVSTVSGIPFSEVKDDTVIHAYMGPNGKPTMGYGSTVNKGGNQVSMGQRTTKKKAQQNLSFNLKNLATNLSQTLRPWKKMSPKQKAGTVALQYSMGPDAHRGNQPEFQKYARAIQNGDTKKATSPGVLPMKAQKQSAAIGMMRDGVRGYQSGGTVNFSPTVNVKAMMRPVLNQMETLISHYDPEFFVRQGRKATQSPIIIVNNNDGGGGTGGMIPSGGAEGFPAVDTGMPNYTDIAHIYSTMCRGLKI